MDKFLIRKSAAARRTTTSSSCSAADNDNNSINGGGGGGGGGIHWCNASATSQGTFGTVQSTTTTNFTSASSSSLATYSKKDIALTKRSNSISSSSCRRYETTCVRAQVWDVNVPQSAIENIDSNYSWKNGTNDVTNNNNSTSSVASSSMKQQQQYNHSEKSISPLLLPLLNRINGIILTCPCPSPPSFSSSSNVPTQSSQETNSSAGYDNNEDECSKSTNSISNGGIKSNSHNSNGTWLELELLEVQIAKWMNFIHDSSVVEDNEGRMN